jgi:hypothetical protein
MAIFGALSAATCRHMQPRTKYRIPGRLATVAILLQMFPCVVLTASQINPYVTKEREVRARRCRPFNVLSDIAGGSTVRILS